MNKSPRNVFFYAFIIAVSIYTTTAISRISNMYGVLPESPQITTSPKICRQIQEEAVLQVNLTYENETALQGEFEALQAIVEFPDGYSGCDMSAKPYMDYRYITDETSRQYKLLWSDDVNLDERGFIVDNEGYIAVAMGSYFGEIGQKYNIYLDTGTVLKVFKVEAKSDLHTCSNNFMGRAGDVIEFVIDTQKPYMRENITANGYIFNGNFNNCPDFAGNIVQIERI